MSSGGLALSMVVNVSQVTLHNHDVAVLHQSVPDETQHGRGSTRFLVEPCVRGSGSGMRGIGRLLAPEVDFGTAVGVGIEGHGVGPS